MIAVLMPKVSTNATATGPTPVAIQPEKSVKPEPICFPGTEYNTANLSAEISENNCPETQCVECRRAMQWPSQYAKLYSKNLNATFLCDTRTDGGGWILIQRRLYKTTSFKRDWNKYKNGFGSICGDYWLGNENIFRITNSGPYELRIDMVYNGKKFYAQYTEFYIDGEGSNYRLRVRGFTKGNVRDDFYRHNNMQFSTPDRDNDIHQTRHCARYYGAGWWYHGCHSNNLNGVFNVSKYFGFSVSWESVTGNYKSVESVEMKIRKMRRPLMV
ncbi:Ficolin-2 [Bulinus truncatus]|nr:Ficolin-2 [Bulinus truncatus]